ncbi:MAG TPA: hypothetical protein VIT44_08635 [Cyclobacteriaceae bacterium]
MNRKTSLYYIAVFLMLISIHSVSAQKNKSDSTRHYNNIIRVNVSNYVLFGGNVILGYERVVTPSQTFSINFGTASIPSLSSSNDSIGIHKQRNRTGINASIDYRFYLKKENKYSAPRGVYLGPYAFYNKARKETEWQINHHNNHNQINADVEFEILGAGVELGYQFILFKRATIDLVLIGPGVALYKLNAKLDGSNAEDRAALRETIQQSVANRYPGMNILFENKQMNSEGNLGVWSAGFRYIIHFGFTF